MLAPQRPLHLRACALATADVCILFARPGPGPAPPPPQTALLLLTYLRLSPFARVSPSPLVLRPPSLASHLASSLSPLRCRARLTAAAAFVGKIVQSDRFWSIFASWCMRRGGRGAARGCSALPSAARCGERWSSGRSVYVLASQASLSDWAWPWCWVQVRPLSSSSSHRLHC